MGQFKDKLPKMFRFEGEAWTPQTGILCLHIFKLVFVSILDTFVLTWQWLCRRLGRFVLVSLEIK